MNIKAEYICPETGETISTSLDFNFSTDIHYSLHIKEDSFNRWIAGNINTKTMFRIQCPSCKKIHEQIIDAASVTLKK